MRQPEAVRRESSALTTTDQQRPDGTRHLGPTLDNDGDPAPSKHSLSTTPPDSDNPLPAILAALINWTLHISIGVAVWFALRPNDPTTAFWYACLAWITASFLHRVAIQRLTRATLGNALLGLRLAHPDGTHPTLGRLTKHWLTTVLKSVIQVLSLP
ncbi:RDD family protein [Nocardia sp. FBN12]|uniref:RDD family protein n=1 Tax=Nocardia sp. FBN12 TaxID=3419766 RepID=UPI003D055842